MIYGVVGLMMLLLPAMADAQSYVALVWRSSPGATRYHVQLSTDPSFASFAVDDSTRIDTAMVVPVAAGTTYYRRIRAGNAAGWSAFGGVETFAMADSISELIAYKIALIDSMMRWGITAISFTDSNFWKFHEREIQLLQALTPPGGSAVGAPMQPAQKRNDAIGRKGTK